MAVISKKSNLLAVRIQPWQLFRFKKWVEYSGKRPSIVIQEALQIYFSTLNLPRPLIEKWLKEFRSENNEATLD